MDGAWKQSHIVIQSWECINATTDSHDLVDIKREWLVASRHKRDGEASIGNKFGQRNNVEKEKGKDNVERFEIVGRRSNRDGKEGSIEKEK